MGAWGQSRFLVAAAALLLLFALVESFLKNNRVAVGFLYGALGTPFVLALLRENGEQFQPKVVAVKMVLSGLLWAAYAYWRECRRDGGKQR